MPEPHESRLVRLEVQMANLTDKLTDAEAAIKELTTALHELRGAFRGAMWLGGVIASVVGAVVWAASWVYDKIGGGV